MGTRNHNGFGSITKLQGKRKRPYMVRISVRDGSISKQKVIGYGETKEEATQILSDYHQMHFNIHRESITLADIYTSWLDSTLLTGSTLAGLKSAYNHIKHLSDMKYIDIKHFHMQKTITDCPKGAGTKSQIKSLWHHLDLFAYGNDIIFKMHYMMIVVPPQEKAKRSIFTDEEIKKLWTLTDNRYVQLTLIYLYTGLRRDEWLNMDKSSIVDGCLIGGLKTKAGKNRKIPIHPRIEKFVLDNIGKDKYTNTNTMYGIWKRQLNKLGFNHVLHECRHTFETRLNNAGANQKCIDLLMGHTSANIGTDVYTHKTIDQLRDTILLLN